jgi:DNA repair photolyase
VNERRFIPGRDVFKGRGAVSNHTGRFEALEREAFDDGWGSLDEPIEKLETEITTEHTRSIFSKNDSPDVPFDRSINPYKGCEHGCIYCFARPTHAYLGLSPGRDFETRIVAKPEAAVALERELSKPKYHCEVIALGANTDPYQPIERRLRITRAVLEVLADFQHPVGIVTKSFAVTRDIDILARMAQKNLANVHISLTSLNRETARRMEPRAAAPERRLQAVKMLADAGIPVGVLVSPIVPGLTDHEIEALCAAAKAAGAGSADYILLRLPLEIKELFEEWLEVHYPDRKARILSLIRQCRGGKLYDSTFGTRMSGTGPYADLINARFARAAREHGLDGYLPELDTTQFHARPKHQLSLF